MTQVKHKKLLPHDYLLVYTVLPFVPKKLTPNMITKFRFGLIPLVLVILALEKWNIGIPLFLFASFTDLLDGSLARWRNQITKWGSFYDPIADKMLITSVVLLIFAQHVSVVFALVIILVEAVIILGGIVFQNRGQKIKSANFYGKMKMFLQVIGITSLLLALWLSIPGFISFSIGIFCLALVFAVISLFTYGL